MSDIARQERFLKLTTWLISYAQQDEFPQDCGTIQGIGASGESGAIQNIGVVPEHRGLGLGRALFRAMMGSSANLHHAMAQA